MAEFYIASKENPRGDFNLKIRLMLWKTTRILPAKYPWKSLNRMLTCGLPSDLPARDVLDTIRDAVAWRPRDREYGSVRS